MANNAEFTMTFKVREDGSLVAVEKNISKAGKAVEGLNSANSKAAKSSGDLYDKQAKGIIGTANSTKSFSKLSQTIGDGGHGLVGAYATLAANIFAVSAAFNALRSAQQAEMVLQGLEAQGARTGRTLTVAADKLREMVGFGISAQDSMKATAQFTSAGFSTDELQKLGKVAQETSLALGRNLPDSLDRLIKGTTKLEPELLDELGIMTKLGDSTAAYALKTGKSATSLSQFEKRQAFLNAVLEEGRLKFGGISDSVDTNPYDKLAAKFNDLTNNVLNFINRSGLNSFVSFLSDNILALAGVVVLFGTTIQKTLLGSLNDLSRKSVQAAAAARDAAAETRKATAIEMETAKAKQLVALQESRNIELNSRSTKSDQR